MNASSSDPFHPGQRRLEVGRIGLGRARVAHADRRVAGRRLAPRAAGIAEHPLREVGEVGEVLIDEGVAGAAEAVEPVLDVGGVARLRHLAVIDDVDPGIGLAPDDAGDRLGDPRAERRASTGTPSSLANIVRTRDLPGAAGCRCGW